MKKIISLLASIAMLATMVTSVSAASLATNAPSVDTYVEEMEAAAYAEMVGEPLPDGCAAYIVSADVTGLDLSNIRGGSGFQDKKLRTGVLLMAAGYDIVWDSDENIVAVMPMDDGIAASGGAIKSAFLATKVTEGIPTTSDSATTAETATEAHLNAYIVVVSGEVTGTVTGEAKISVYDKNNQTETKNYYAADCAYTVNGEAGKVVTLTVAGGEEPPVVPPVDDDETKVEVSDKIDLESEGVIGAAWDVVIKNFDSAKSYMTTFTDLDENVTRDDEAKAIDVSAYAETEGDLGFAVIMRLTAARNVALTIDVQ